MPNLSVGPSVMNPAPLKIVFVIPSQVTADTLIGSGAIVSVQREFQVNFICAEEFRGVPATEQTDILQSVSLGRRWRRFLDIHFWYHELFVYLRQAGIRYQQSFKIANLKAYQRWVHSIFALGPFHRAISWIDRSVVFRSDSVFDSYMRRVRPDLVVFPGSAMDSYSHHVVRSAQSLGIPALMVVSHWDYFSKKGMLRTVPDRIYLWGEDMRAHALRHASVAPEALRILGAPHFQKYLSNDISRIQARRDLNLPMGARILLFAGTSTPYDEVAVLARLSEFIVRYGHSDVCILYRPHPRAWQRIVRAATDPGSLPGVRVDPPNAPWDGEGDRVTTLMHAVDGIVSPFSTMILEAAVCGHPAFCIGFADGVNNWNFAEALNNEHIAVLQDRSWLDICKDSARLESQFGAFLARIGLPETEKIVREEVRKTVYNDGRTYAVRLKDAIIEDFFSNAPSQRCCL